jgi:hypothetical protein
VTYWNTFSAKWARLMASYVPLEDAGTLDGCRVTLLPSGETARSCSSHFTARVLVAAMSRTAGGFSSFAAPARFVTVAIEIRNVKEKYIQDSHTGCNVALTQSNKLFLLFKKNIKGHEMM